MDFYGWKPYVSVAERRRKAMREMEKRRKKGHAISPVTIDGRDDCENFLGQIVVRKSGADTATMPIVCRADEPMCATVRWSISRLSPARSRRWSAARSFTR